MTLKQALWEIVRDENIIITNQNIDWLLDRASKKAAGDAQALKESILERKQVIEENIPCAHTNEEKVSVKGKLLLINENKSNNSDFKSNNFDFKSNEELFKQALVEGLNRHFDKTIEEAKKIEQIEEMANTIEHIERLFRDVCGGVASYKMIAEHLYNAGYRKQSENAIELPCKIGDEVYCIIAKGELSAGLIFTGHIIKRKVDKLVYDGSRWEMMSYKVYPDFKDENGLIYAYFGDLAFVNEEEAKARLEEILEVGRKH